MNELQESINHLEERVTTLKKELRRIKSAIKKADKLSLVIPSEIIIKKENIEAEIKKFKQELKALKNLQKL